MSGDTLIVHQAITSLNEDNAGILVNGVGLPHHNHPHHHTQIPLWISVQLSILLLILSLWYIYFRLGRLGGALGEPVSGPDEDEEEVSRIVVVVDYDVVETQNGGGVYDQTTRNNYNMQPYQTMNNGGGGTLYRQTYTGASMTGNVTGTGGGGSRQPSRSQRHVPPSPANTTDLLLRDYFRHTHSHNNGTTNTVLH